MWNWLRNLDRILRGEATALPELSGETIKVPTGGLSVVVLGLGMFYGICMGCFALINRDLADGLGQLAASTLKVPALFFLTLVVTFPSLYVFNALVGSRLTVRAMLRLLIASLAVNLSVLASLGTIVAFFSLCATKAGYGFMVLLNVVVFALSGVLGLVFLLQTLHRLSVARHEGGPPLPPVAKSPEAEAADPQLEPSPGPLPAEPSEDQTIDVELVEEPGALDQLEGYVLGRHVKKVFGCWIVLFGVVGGQMGWVLRPFIGSPDISFAWFRERESNFFEAVLGTLRNLFY